MLPYKLSAVPLTQKIKTSHIIWSGTSEMIFTFYCLYLLALLWTLFRHDNGFACSWTLNCWIFMKWAGANCTQCERLVCVRSRFTSAIAARIRVHVRTSGYTTFKTTALSYVCNVHTIKRKAIKCTWKPMKRNGSDAMWLCHGAELRTERAHECTRERDYLGNS